MGILVGHDSEDINECEDGTLQLIYGEILDQWKGNFRSFQTFRERLGQIIAFIGIILNLELLGIIQIFSNRISINYIEILVLSSFFIIASLITAAYAYRTASFKGIRSNVCLAHEYTSKSKNELIKEICEHRLEDIRKNKKILHQKVIWTHISLNNLVLGIIFVAIFIIVNIAHSFTVIFISLLILVVVILLSYIYEAKKYSKKLAIEK